MVITFLPVLYSINKSGKKQKWSIHVVDNVTFSTIITNYGQIGGKITTVERVVSSGKNLNKANATTHNSQAINDAQTKWNLKKDQGYSTDSNPGDKQSDKQTFLPMLALDYNKYSHNIIFPCYVQPKLDGVRALLYNEGLYSRTGKKFNVLDHILMDGSGNGNSKLYYQRYILDGELYSDKLSFQELTGLVQKDKLTKDDYKKIQYVNFIVYDYIDVNLDYYTRFENLQLLFGKNNSKFKFCKLHETYICPSKDNVIPFHDKFVKDGYEGLILRNFKGGYTLKYRSKNLQKLKMFMTEEFKIIGFTEGSGTEIGLVIWKCETDTKQTFNVRPQGTYQQRKKLFKDGNKYIGKYLTVKFFEYTNDQIPRFPVGLTIRDYE